MKKHVHTHLQTQNNLVGEKKNIAEINYLGSLYTVESKQKNRGNIILRITNTQRGLFLYTEHRPMPIDLK